MLHCVELLMMYIRILLFEFIGVYQMFSLKPPMKEFIVGRCETNSIPGVPCCDVGNTCELFQHSVEGKL